MRAEDKNTAEVAKKPMRLYHHGPLGRVLQRFLHERGERQDFDLVALEQLWLRAAAHDPAIGLHLFSQFSRQDWHVLACLGFYAPNAAESTACWVRYQRLASSLDAVDQVERDDLLGVSIRVHSSEVLERYLVEHYMTMAVTQLNAAAERQLIPARVCLRHPQPAYWAEYQPLLGEQLVFGAAYNQLWFRRADLLHPTPVPIRACLSWSALNWTAGWRSSAALAVPLDRCPSSCAKECCVASCWRWRALPTCCI
ncbi:AraC family transcriptional regulator ligand-binding domain-containing protein [Halopseudomonas pachastrellae]|nr:AraC family transcriptional regulator ligand-binding domain-containing protein [Halopseudomonas pachastrellae]